MSTLPTILVVDDHSDIRRLLAVALSREFHVLEANSGLSALEAIRLHRPKAVLLDVMMPGELDGLDVLKAVKSDPDLQDTRVAMVTARGQTSDSAEASQHGADAYFIKPFSPMQVLAWLRTSVK
jgi:DNA-binding response OmpR family regulator